MKDELFATTATGKSGLVTEQPYHFQNKAIELSYAKDFVRYPKGFEWFISIWNFDIFFGRIPFCKTLALICILVAVLTNF